VIETEMETTEETRLLHFPIPLHGEFPTLLLSSEHKKYHHGGSRKGLPSLHCGGGES
jgi:hypothetical protein